MSYYTIGPFTKLAREEIPQLVELSPNHFACAFSCMKLIPARCILDAAEQAGSLRRGGLIVESTSGSFGLALAILGAQRGYRVIIVGDAAIDAQLERRLVNLGAVVERISQPAHSDEGPQKLRVRRVQELLREHPGAFWPRQYQNPDNARGYVVLANILRTRLAKIDYLVGTVGTGGSMCGSAAALRPYIPNLRVVGVDTHHSVLFGHPSGTRLLRGLGNSLVPDNLDHEQFDEVHWVTAAEAYAATHALHRRHGLFMGGTSGAAYLVGRWLAGRAPNQVVVTIMPDEGHRYVDTVYNPQWVEGLPDWDPHGRKEPVYVSYPTEVMDRWSRFAWGRRSLEDVTERRSHEPRVGRPLSAGRHAEASNPAA